MDPETEPTVTVEVSTPNIEPSEPAVETAAEAVVLAAETAVALAEGQAALAEQQAAEIVTEAAANAEIAASAAQDAERNLEWLVGEVARQGETIALLTLEISDLKNTTLQQSQEPETEITTTVIDPETGMMETTSLSTPEDTSELTSETQTEVTDESGVVESAAQEKVRRRVRWI